MTLLTLTPAIECTDATADSRHCMDDTADTKSYTDH